MSNIVQLKDLPGYVQYNVKGEEMIYYPWINQLRHEVRVTTLRNHISMLSYHRLVEILHCRDYERVYANIRPSIAKLNSSYKDLDMGIYRTS